MRVRILTQHYAPEVTAGRFRVEAFAESFARHGHRVEVLCPIPNHPQGETYPGYRRRPLLRRRVGGVEVTYVRVWASPRRDPLSRLAYYGTYAGLAAGGGLVTGRPDVIVASSPPLSVPAAAASIALPRRVPWIFDVRDPWPLAAEQIGELEPGRLTRAAERLERWLYRHAAAITTVNERFAEHVRARVADPSKVHLIPNGTTAVWLGAGERPPGRPELGLPEDRFVWTYAGNLGPSRRLDVAVEAAGLLGDRFQLLIIGEGATRSRLEARARELPPGTVAFRDLMPAPRAAACARASDALLIALPPELGDTVPAKLYDFAAVGRPIVLAASGESVRIALAAGIGVAAEPDDPRAIADAVAGLAADPVARERLGARGREFAASHRRDLQADRMVALAGSLS